MANYYDYITNRGVIVPDTATVLTDVENEFKAVFGQDLDVSPETVQGRLIEMIARNRIFSIQTAAAVSNMLNLQTANGFVLDDLGSLFLLSRQAATKTRVSVELGGVSGTVVPAGTRLQSTAGDIFSLVGNYTIGDAVLAVFESVETGPVPCVANSLTIILDAVNGLETATNPAGGELGTDLESDTEFRARIKAGLMVNSIAVLSAIKANLEALPGVKGTYLWDNYTGSSQTVDGIVVPDHSLLAIVDGGDNQDIADVLYAKKTIGTAYLDSATDPDITIVSTTATDPNYGTEYPVKFARPKAVGIQVDITVVRQGYTGSDIVTDVKNAILAWSVGDNDEVDGIKIGTDISPFEISAAVSNTIPEIFIRDCKIGKDGGATAAAIIPMSEAEKGVITGSDITVTVM